MTNEEIHGIWMYIGGKADGLLEAGGAVDFPVLFANAVLECSRRGREWQGLTDKERIELWWNTDMSGVPEHDYGKAVEAKLKEKNA